MSPEMEIALTRYDEACDALIGAETAYAIALRQYLASQRVDLLTVGGGTASERCDRACAVRTFQDCSEDFARAMDRHRDAYRAALDLSIGYAYGGAR